MEFEKEFIDTRERITTSETWMAKDSTTLIIKLVP